ncbi:sphingosine-1-phosphate lyase isoform X5 [Rhipicephalus microplus]|uniref:sphingosine-1-phosphate lyase isoform X5 n=1 Tax=Rhipicephalus microplus TaxID=6941 RepID=UPI003F6D4A12
MTTLKESLLYAFWRVCGLVCFHRDMINARYQQTEPAVLIATTALVTYVGQRALRRLIYGEGFVPNVRRGLLASLRNLPIVRNYVHEQLDKIAVDVERSLNKCYAHCTFVLELPDKGWTPETILERMAENDSLSHVEWKKGVVSGAIYTEHDPKLEGLMVSVYERHLRSNPLHSDVFVGVRKMESEVIRWCCNLFHGGPESCGSVAPCFFGLTAMTTICDDGNAYFLPPHGILEPGKTDNLPTRVTSPAATEYKEQRDMNRLRGHGTRPANSMAKPLLLLLQVAPCFFGLTAMTTNCDDRNAYFLPPHGILEPGKTDNLPTRVTSPAAMEYKEQRDMNRLRGHGTRPADSMAKPLLLLLQVGYRNEIASCRSDDLCLLILPCPRRCYCIIVDFWSAVMMLVMSGDVEENPGPATTQELLQTILENQAKSERDLNAIRDQISEVNVKTDKLTSSLALIHEMNLRIDILEATVRQQAERLVEYENRSRRNNLLVFGLAEKSIESESDLMVSVVDKIFKEKLDVEVKTIERIHRMGKVQPGKVRPVIMKFYDYREKERVMKNCPKLKGSPISISNDYASETVEVRRKLWQSAAAERDSGMKVSLNHDKLYTWDQNKNERCVISNSKGKRDGRAAPATRSNAASTSNTSPSTSAPKS